MIKWSCDTSFASHGATIRRTAVREAGVSQHRGGPIESIPETLEHQSLWVPRGLKVPALCREVFASRASEVNFSSSDRKFHINFFRGKVFLSFFFRHFLQQILRKVTQINGDIWLCRFLPTPPKIFIYTGCPRSNWTF